MSNIEAIRALREKTGAGVTACQTALKASGGDLTEAVRALAQKGFREAREKAHRATTEGIIHAYIHPGGKIGVLLEVHCETDFVARNDAFQAFVREVALHLAGSVPPPRFIRKEEALPDSVPQEDCLMEMPFIKDPSITIKELLARTTAKVGENIVLARFTRYQLTGGER